MGEYRKFFLTDSNISTTTPDGQIQEFRVAATVLKNTPVIGNKIDVVEIRALQDALELIQQYRHQIELIRAICANSHWDDQVYQQSKLCLTATESRIKQLTELTKGE